jgi:hypothetical protein
LSSSRLDGSGRPILKNSLQRRIARARAAELDRRVKEDVKLFLEQFPPNIPVLKPISTNELLDSLRRFNPRGRGWKF